MKGSTSHTRRAERSERAREKCQTTVPVMRGAVSDNLNMSLDSGDEETLEVYAIQREIKSLRKDLRELQWTPEEKYRHESRGLAEHNERCVICVKVGRKLGVRAQEQWTDDGVDVTELQSENARLKVCAETSAADRDSVRVEHEKRNAELHFEVLEDEEKLTVREQENSKLECLVKMLRGEVERTHKSSEASTDKITLVRLAGEDDSQHLTEKQREFKKDLPTDHDITDVTENTLCSSLTFSEMNTWMLNHRLQQLCQNHVHC